MFSPKHKILPTILLALLFFSTNSNAITLTAGQENFTTTTNITESGSGIISSLSGTSGSYNTITNNHIITTGDDGATSSAFGITTTGDYNQITNSLGASIITTGASGRGIDVDNFAIIDNYGTITTQLNAAHGIYARSDNEINNYGTITTQNSGVGIYLQGDNNIAQNSGNIETSGGGYGVRLQGNNNDFTNSSSIATSGGDTAYGIYISASSALNASDTNYTTISNSGSITSSSHGVYNLDAYANINNSGTITSDLTRTSQNAIRSEADNVTITNSGTITSNNNAIYSQGSNVIINNSGTISGGVRLGNATFNILGGSVSGVIDGTNSANEDVGVVVIGSSSANNVIFNQQADFDNLANVTIQNNSTLQANHEINSALITIDDSATLEINSGSAINSAIQSVSDGVGNLDLNTDFNTNYNIGISGNSLANINVNSGYNFNVSRNIYSANSNVSGTMDLTSTNNITIHGSVIVEDGGNLKIDNNSQSITNNLELKSGSTLTTSLTNGTIGNLTITNAAIIDENAKISIDSSQNANYIADNTTFSLINASDISQINKILDSNIIIDGQSTNRLGLLQFITEVSASGLNLKATRLQASEITNNSNITNIYSYLNDISSNSSGELLNFQNYLNSSNVNTNNAENIIEEISPFPLKASFETMSQNAAIVANISQDRLLNYNNLKQNAIWVKTLGQKTTQNKAGDDNAFNINSVGIVAGVDKEISDDFLIGFNLSHIRSQTKTQDNLKSSVISSYQAQFYSRKFIGDYFFDNFSVIALNHFAQKRKINSLSLEASSGYFAQSFLQKNNFGKEINFKNNFSIIPQTSISYNFNNIPSYQEKGAEELNLNVSSANSNFVKVAIGNDFNWKTKLPKIEYNDLKFTDLATTFKISYEHLLIDSNSNQTAKLQGQSQSFQHNISQIDKSQLNLGLIINLCNEYESIFNIEINHQKRSTSSVNNIVFNFIQRF